MKTISPPGYHHNGFVATHALGHMMYSIYIYIYIYIYTHTHTHTHIHTNRDLLARLLTLCSHF